MASHDQLSRRDFVKVAGVATTGLAVGYGWRPGVARAATAAPSSLHLQYGSDPGSSMAVSWQTPVGVTHPRLRVGPAGDGLAEELVPETRVGTTPSPDLPSSASNIYPASEYQHGFVSGLEPGTTYVYEVSHDGADPVSGTFSTPLRGRHAFRFSAFGDQGTGDLNDIYTTAYGSWIVPQVEQLQPAFNLHLGDLAYANLQQGNQRGPAWDRFVATISGSAAARPWMPALGNHEICAGTGPQGYGAYHTRFQLPANGTAGYLGNWYAFSVGSVRVIVTDANDICYQNAGIDMYLRGYSGGAQLAWLERELAAARATSHIDWVVCVVHQLMCSSSLEGNGCDLGIRLALQPLFDRYGVDLVLSGHDHDYERTYALSGTVPGSATHTPKVATPAFDLIDARTGTVYMVLGGGGALPTGPYDTTSDATKARVIVEPKGSASETEDAAWSAVRNPHSPFGFATFDVDPGGGPGELTSIEVIAWQTAVGAGGAPTVLERFTLTRPRRDAPHKR
jgi:hypothetical protein